MDNTDWSVLEQSIETLVRRCQQLTDENLRLRQHQTILEQKQGQLQASQAQAHQKVTALIKRLQTIENGQST